MESVEHFKFVGITVSHYMNRQLVIEAILNNIKTVIISVDVSIKFSSVACYGVIV